MYCIKNRRTRLDSCPSPGEVDGKEVEGYFANVRTSDKKVLGIVGKDYQIVQNTEAFAFTDKLLGNQGVHYDTAGSLQEGKRVWMLARMNSCKLLDDEVVPYLLFSNGHDGRHAVRVAITPVRVVCQNTLNLALVKAERSWATIHMGKLDKKLDEAARTLGLANYYINELNGAAERLYDIKVNDARLHQLIEQVLPLPKNGRGYRKVYERRAELLTRYNSAPDLECFRGTGWGFVGAVSDLVGHSQPKRLTPTSQENRFARVTGGSPELDRAYKLLLGVAA